MHHLPAAYSTLLASDLARLTEADYGLVSPRVTLLRRGFNDTYRIEAGDTRYILRLYLHDKYYVSGPDDLRFELDLLDHLGASGVGVATALPRLSGEKLGTLRAAEGVRHYALFHYASGVPAGQPDEAQVRTLGEALARVHLAADRFHTAHPRHSLDVAALIDGPLQRLRPYLAEQPDDLAILERTASQARRRLNALALPEGGWGIIHGDPHTGNCHYHEGRPVLFDFDTCGYGWRAYDVAISWGDTDNPHSAAFLEAYQALRPLSAEEITALPDFVKARAIWDAGDILTLAHIWGENTAKAVVRRMVRELKRLGETDPEA